MPSPAPDPLVGQRLGGRYEVRGPLGSGGWAKVYRAWDASLHREVALKVPHAQLVEDERDRDAFLREIRKLVAVEHPNVVRVFDAVEAPDGRPVAVLEFMRGGSLEQRLDALPGRRQAPGVALAWLAPIADALDHLHRDHSLVHADVKPQNILFDGSGRPRLSDFGIVVSLDPTKSSRVLTTGSSAGTPIFMAPELLLERARPSPRSDQYAVATTLYLALSGRLPYAIPDADNAFLFVAQWGRALDKESPVPLLDAAPGVTPAVSRAVMRAMARAPEDRFASCGECADAIREAIRPPAPQPAAEVLPPSATAVVEPPERSRNSSPDRSNLWLLPVVVAIVITLGTSLFVLSDTLFSSSRPAEKTAKETAGRGSSTEPQPSRGPSEGRNPSSPPALPPASAPEKPTSPSAPTPAAPAAPVAGSSTPARAADLDASLDPRRPIGTPGRYRNLLAPDPDPEIPLESKGHEGGEITMLYGPEPASFNTLTHPDRSLIEEVEAYVADRPATRQWADPTKFAPALCWRIEVSPDFREYTLFFRSDVLWHVPNVDLARYPHLAGPHAVTARDYKFTIDLIRNPQSDCAGERAMYDDLESVRVVNEQTCVMRWKATRWQSLEATLDRSPIPEFVFAHAEDGRRFPADTVGTQFNDHWFAKVGVCGCGPYRMASYERGKSITLERHDGWYGAKEGRKYSIATKRLLIDSTRDAVVERLASGELDLVGLSTAAYRKAFVENRDPNSPFNDGRVESYRSLQPAYSYIGWKNSHPLFRDVRVRRALALACNREDIAKTVYLDRLAPMSGPLYPDGPQYDPTYAPLPFDLSEASRLLDEAGWRKNSTSGVREKSVDGVVRRMEFKVLFAAPMSDFEQVTRRYKSDLATIGVGLTAEPVEWSQYVKRVEDREFEALAGAWATDAFDFDADPIWHSRHIADPGSSNYLEYSNPEVDRLCDALHSEMDVSKRNAAARRIARILHDDQPCCFLGWQRIFGAHQARVRNVTGHPYKSRPFLRTFPMYVVEPSRATSGPSSRTASAKPASEPPPADASAPPAVRGRVVVPGYEPWLATIDWDKVGSSLKEMVAVAPAMRDATVKKDFPPNLFASVQKHNTELVLAAIAAGKALEVEPNSAWPHPAFMANSLAAALDANGRGLTDRQADDVAKGAKRFASELEQRRASYDDRVPAIQKLIDETEIDQQFVDGAFKTLTPAQAALLGDSSVKGRLQLDLFSPAILWGGHALPLDFSDKDDLLRKLEDATLKRLQWNDDRRAAVHDAVATLVGEMPRATLQGDPDLVALAGMIPLADVLAAAKREVAMFERLIQSQGLDASTAKAVRSVPLVRVPLRSPAKK